MSARPFMAKSFPVAAALLALLAASPVLAQTSAEGSEDGTPENY